MTPITKPVARARTLLPIAAAVAAVLAAPGAGQSLFSTPTFTQVDGGVPFTTSKPRTATIDDFNADGLPDVAITEDAGIRVVLGDGTGGFAGYVFTPLNLAAFTYGFTPAQILGSPDLNLDGFPDLVTMGSALNVRVHLNDGLCGFAFSTPVPATSLPNTCCPGTPVFADLDGILPVEMIAKDFIAYPTYTQDILRILTFNPTTNAFQFSQAFNLPSGEYCGAIATGDFNGDSTIDIAYATYTGLYPQTPVVQLRALANMGGAVFQAPAGSPWSVPQSTGCGTCSFTNPCSPSLGPMIGTDVTGDGIDDLVAFGATHYTLTGCYTFWTFTGDPFALLLPPSFGRGIGPGGGIPFGGSISFADVDDDRHVDIAWGKHMFRVTPVFGVDWISIVNLPVFSGLCNGPRAEAVGDMNLDGVPDFVAASPYHPVGNRCPTWVGTAINLSRRQPGCGTSAKFFVGTPNPGNAGYSFTLSSSVPNAQAILGLSLAEAAVPVPGCILGLDLSPANLVVPTSYGLGITTTNGIGNATVTIGIPNLPSLVGFQFWGQWIFADPAGPITLGAATWSTSISRRVLIW